MRSMPPQNTIHSARTLHDLLNLILVMRHDLLNLFLFMHHDLLNLSRQSIARFCTFSLLFSVQSINMFVCLVLGLSPWAPGVEILQLFSAIHHGLLVPISSAIHHDFLVSIFSAIHHDLLVPLFSAIRHDLLVPIFSTIRHDLLVPIFLTVRHDVLVQFSR